jgi:putative tryptophan/tyrosine transport system substrate-binding protein
VDAFLKEVSAKRLELLRELVPHAEVIGVLANPGRADASKVTSDIEVAARVLGQKIAVAQDASASDIDAAIAELVRQRIGALLIASDSLFSSQREKLAAVAARNSLPSSFNLREFAVAGGLMSYGEGGRVLSASWPLRRPISSRDRWPWTQEWRK